MTWPKLILNLCIITVVFSISLGQAEKPPKLFPVRVKDKWGFIDPTGKLVIKPQFDDADQFSEGLASVRQGTRWFYINLRGQKVIVGTFSGSKWAVGGGEFSEGLASAPSGENCAWGYIDRKGRQVIAPQFYSAGRFSDGLAAASLRTENAKDGFIDRAGRFVIDPRFDKADDFSEGLAAVAINKKWGFIDKLGRYIIGSGFDYAYKFSEGWAAILVKDKWGFIDHHGSFMIKPQFQGAEDFSEGLAPVEVDGKWGYIDKTGTFVIPAQFSAARVFSGGLARVSTAELDSKLNIIGSFECIEAWRWNVNGHLQYIDRSGRYVWKSSDPSSTQP